MLREAGWLSDVELIYWGDLDAHGFQILSQAREYFPHLKSILMDRATLDALAEYHVAGEETPVTFLENLTPEEAGIFEYLRVHRLRLEQERVPLAMVREVIG